MRNYGNLRDKIPVTFWAMMIGTLAITGVGIPLSYDMFGLPIGLAGFVSKDAIIEGAWAGGSGYAFWMLVIAALFTSFYSWRLMFITFYGEARGDAHTHEHAHESPRVMTVPLMVLAVGSVLLGMVYYNSFVGKSSETFFGESIYVSGLAEHGHGAEKADDHGEGHGDEAHGDDHAKSHVDTGVVLLDYHYVPTWVKLAPFIAMLLGLGGAYFAYILRPGVPEAFVRMNPGLYKFLLNKWYFDELYDWVFVKPAMWLGRFLWKKGDGATIDGGINGIAMGIIPFFTRLAGKAQSGYLFHYAFAMFLGLAAIITYMVIGRAG
ncbi:MAG: proton-conducting transporter membrane subunit, partial [Pseudomonadota bacterium]